jgi:integrase/recombinase XerD
MQHTRPNVLCAYMLCQRAQTLNFASKSADRRVLTEHNRGSLIARALLRLERAATMFEKIFKRPYYVARHASAPFAEERRRYLSECARRGDAKVIVRQKAEELYWVACKLHVYGDLDLTLDQLRAAALDCDWDDRARACRRKLNRRATRVRFVKYAARWLRFLGCLRQNEPPTPFSSQLEQFCRYAREERGFTEATVDQYVKSVRLFLRWYGALDRALTQVRLSDIDSYLACGGSQRWCRKTVSNMVSALRAFFRYGASQGWARPTLPSGICGPPMYSLEKLPAGPTWVDVQRLLAGLDADRPKDIRDRAILMLFAVYGLREREVAQLRLDHLDWERDLLHVPRVKRRDTQVYPLLPSVGNAIVRYLQTVRRPSSAHRELFLTLRSPYGPMTGAAFYQVAAPRLKALGVQTAHHGPHSLRHACAARLVAEGFSLKEIGDHLGHRTTSATRVYAKVDLPGLREVAAFDLGEVQ